MMAAVLTTLAVALLAYLLGRSTVPLFVGRCTNSLGHILQLELLLGNVLLSVIGLLLAECGRFTLPRVVWTSVLVCVVSLGVRRWQPRSAASLSYGVADVVGVALMIGAYAWAFPAFDTSLFGSDSSVYLASGVHVAEHGSLVIHDPTIVLLRPELRRELFPLYHPDSHTPRFSALAAGWCSPKYVIGAAIAWSPPSLRSVLPRMGSRTRSRPATSSTPIWWRRSRGCWAGASCCLSAPASGTNSCSSN